MSNKEKTMVKTEKQEVVTMENKVIINGIQLDTKPKMVDITISGKAVKLTLTYVDNPNEADNWEWFPVPADRKLKAIAKKQGNKIENTLQYGEKTIFTNLSAQSVFEVVLAKYGQSKGVTDSIYKKSNPYRKESKNGGSSAKLVLDTIGEW